MKAFWLIVFGLVIATLAMFALRQGPPVGSPRNDGSGAAPAGAMTERLADSMPIGPRRPTTGTNEGNAHPITRPQPAAPDIPSQSASVLAPAPRSIGENLPDHPAFAFVRVSDPASVSDWLDDLLDVDYTPRVVVRPPVSGEALIDAPALGGARSSMVADSNDPNMIAGRYPLRGSGTRQDPYRLPWEALVAVRETYRPRTGHNDLPEWLDRIDGKHVALTGYLLLPLVQESNDEVLLMRNQWDGCCIGVPPTPYDAIEVKLTTPLTGQSAWRMNYGTISGRFTVDPYIVSGWLIGLYLFDEATLIDSGL